MFAPECQARGTSSFNTCRAIEYSPDPEGHNGIFLGKNVVTEASKALTKAMWKVGLVY